jgi:hypothetical protein
MFLFFAGSCKNFNSTNAFEIISKDSLNQATDSFPNDGSDINNIGNFIPDVKVNNLELSNPESIITNVGDLQYLMTEDAGLPHFSLTNNGGIVKLSLISFPGSGYNDIYQFILEYNSGLEKLKSANYSNFITESNLQLGISKSDVLKIKGNSYRVEKKDNLEILTYRITNYNSSPFLKKYNLPCYFMEFELKDDKVMKIKFGFDYP